MIYNCPACRQSIASWIINNERFECPSCQATLASNSKRTFRRSIAVAFAAWLTFLIGMQHYLGSWTHAIAVSIEGGGILSAIIAALYYQLATKIEEKN